MIRESKNFITPDGKFDGAAWDAATSTATEAVASAYRQIRRQTSPTIAGVLNNIYQKEKPEWAKTPTPGEVLNAAYEIVSLEKKPRRRSRRPIHAEEEIDKNADPKNRMLLNIVNEITLQDIKKRVGVEISAQVVDEALTETRARIDISIAEIEAEPLSLPQEIPVSPFNSGVLELGIRDEIWSRIKPENKFATEQDIKNSGKVTAKVQYRDIPKLSPLAGKGGEKYRWYIRKTIPIGSSTAQFPERVIEGETEIVTLNHPEQLILRREFVQKDG